MTWQLGRDIIPPILLMILAELLPPPRRKKPAVSENDFWNEEASFLTSHTTLQSAWPVAGAGQTLPSQRSLPHKERVQLPPRRVGNTGAVTRKHKQQEWPFTGGWVCVDKDKGGERRREA